MYVIISELKKVARTFKIKMEGLTNKQHSYRKTKFYKKLNNYMAVAIAEGFCEGEGATQDEQLCAWQYISDKGLWKGLQGFFGRQVASLKECRAIE